MNKTVCIWAAGDSGSAPATLADVLAQWKARAGVRPGMNADFVAFAQRIQDLVGQINARLDEPDAELSRLYGSFGAEAQQTTEALFNVELPENWLPMYRLIIKTANVFGLTVLDDLEGLAFLPDGRILPAERAADGEALLSSAPAPVKKPDAFPRDLNEFKKIYAPRVKALLDKYGFTEEWESGITEAGYAKKLKTRPAKGGRKVAAGIQYVCLAEVERNLGRICPRFIIEIFSPQVAALVNRFPELNLQWAGGWMRLSMEEILEYAYPGKWPDINSFSALEEHLQLLEHKLFGLLDRLRDFPDFDLAENGVRWGPSRMKTRDDVMTFRLISAWIANRPVYPDIWRGIANDKRMARFGPRAPEPRQQAWMSLEACLQAEVPRREYVASLFGVSLVPPDPGAGFPQTLASFQQLYLHRLQGLLEKHGFTEPLDASVDENYLAQLRTLLVKGGRTVADGKQYVCVPEIDSWGGRFYPVLRVEMFFPQVAEIVQRFPEIEPGFPYGWLPFDVSHVLGYHQYNWVGIASMEELEAHLQQVELKLFALLDQLKDFAGLCDAVGYGWAALTCMWDREGWMMAIHLIAGWIANRSEKDPKAIEWRAVCEEDSLYGPKGEPSKRQAWEALKAYLEAEVPRRTRSLT